MSDQKTVPVPLNRMEAMLLKRLLSVRAEIIPKADQPSWKAFPYGDQRKRRVIWVDAALARAFCERGLFCPTARGYRLSEQVKDLLDARQLEASHQRSAAAANGHHKLSDCAGILSSNKVTRSDTGGRWIPKRARRSLRYNAV